MTPEQQEQYKLLQAAYSAGLLDAAKAVKCGLTPNELERFADEQSEAYALSVIFGNI